MSDVDARETPSSKPPPSGLHVHSRLEKSRQLVRVGLEELCQSLNATLTEPAPTQQSAGLLLAMVKQLLVRQLGYEAAQLELLSFPVMDELRQRQAAVLGRLSDLELAINDGCKMKSILNGACDLEQHSMEYFDWIDSFFGKAPRDHS